MDNEKKLRKALKPIIVKNLKLESGMLKEDFVEKTIKHIFGILLKVRDDGLPTGASVIKKELESIPDDIKDLVAKLNADAEKKDKLRKKSSKK